MQVLDPMNNNRPESVRFGECLYRAGVVVHNAFLIANIQSQNTVSNLALTLYDRAPQDRSTEPEM